MATVICPGCKSAFRVEDNVPDQQVRCLSCSMLFSVPRAEHAESFSPELMPIASSGPSLEMGRDDSGERHERTDSANAPPPPPWERSARPPRPSRSRREEQGTPTFVWLLPVIFFLLYLILGGIGVAVISSQPDWRQQWKGAGPGWGKVAAVAKAEDKMFINEMKPGGSVWDVKDVVGLPVFRVLGQPDLTEVGFVEAFDPQFGGNSSACKVYELELEAGRSYTIELMKREPNPLPDPFLALADPKGTIIQRDDDGGGARNSRIRYTPGETGRFRLVACNLFNAQGAYTLSVRVDSEAKK